MMKLKTLSLLLSCFCFVCCSKFAIIQKSDNLDLKYKSAVKYFEAKDYYKASTLFEELIPILKGQVDAEKAQYYYSYSQYYMGQLVLSAYYFKKFYETFPRSQWAEECYYMHCISLYEDSPGYELDQTNTREALIALQVFLEKFPVTKYLQECNDISDKLTYKLELKSYNQAKLFYKMRNFKASVVSLDNLIKDFPSSKFLEEAYFLKLDSQNSLATVSIESKQKERYQSALDYYYFFIDKYPSSKYNKSAEKIYDNIQTAMSALDAPRKKSWWDWLG